MFSNSDILRRSKTSLVTIFWFWLLVSLIQYSKSYNDNPGFIDMEDFLQTEADMISTIQNYLTQEQRRLVRLKIILFDWKEWRISNIAQETQYIAIPQNLFHLFKKLTLDLNQLKRLMLKNSYNDTEVLNKIELPTKDQLKRVILSMVDLQFQYDLESGEIMNGTIMDLMLNTSSSLDTCYFIGNTCSEYNYHQCATDWLETCLSLSPEFSYKISKLIYPSYIFSNQTKNAFDHAINCLNNNDYDTATMHTYQDLGSQLDALDESEIPTLEAQRICRENPTNPILSTLKCRYNHENSAFLKIAPLKEEELHHYPKILLYRDIVYDSEISAIKAEVEKNMGVAEVVGTDGNDDNLNLFTFRISETAFINNELSFLPQLRRRIEDISDLSIKSSEWWQVLNYAPGGFYTLHSDFLPENNTDIEENGNRMTTMLFYFNDVALGGETVFSHIGISVKPTKGLALVWSNVHPNGSENTLLEHTACPVVIGEKWGFTQWMRSLNQKCLKKTYEYDPTILHNRALNSLQSNGRQKVVTTKNS